MEKHLQNPEITKQVVLATSFRSWLLVRLFCQFVLNHLLLCLIVSTDNNLRNNRSSDHVPRSNKLSVQSISTSCPW